MTNPIAVPLTFNSAGPVATAPATLRSMIQQAIAAVQPGYTGDLPGTLIEDVLSTEMGAVVTVDQARAESVVNATPYLAAPYVLAKLGAQFGIPQGTAQNTSVLVVFSGTVGYVVPAGTQVSDGTYTYVLQAPGAIIGADGSSTPSECVATVNGDFAPVAGTVIQVITYLGPDITVTNPSAGIPGTTAQTPESYRSQLLQQYQAPAQSLSDYLEAQINLIPGVSSRLVAVSQIPTGWEVICGGGDQYAVALAIFNGVGDLSTLNGASGVGSTVTVLISNGTASYQVPYVQPAAQVVTCAVNWSTSQLNFTNGQQVNNLTAPAIQDYFNTIPVGSPINLNVLAGVFLSAAASVISSQNISGIEFVITVNGATASPEAGTQIIASASEGYFSSASGSVTVSQA